MEKEIKDLLEIIIGIKASKRKSTLQLALQSARHYCGYEVGKPYDRAAFSFRQNRIEQINANINCSNSDEGDLFLSLFLYLNCLEQIGILFCPVVGSDKNGIVRALSKFASRLLNEKEIEALKCLRHSLAHSFGLVNVSQRGTPTHKYQLSLDDSCSTIIRTEITPWDKDYSNKTEETSVIAYVFSIIRLVETIISEIRNDYAKGTLTFMIDKEEEIKSRYTFIYA